MTSSIPNIPHQAGRPTRGQLGRRQHRGAILLSGVAIAALALAGCGSGTSDTALSNPATTSPSVSASANTLSVSSAWVKACSGRMTGAFAVLRNPTTQNITVTKAETPAAGMTELHETVASEDGSKKMQVAQNGFTVPAGGEFTLAPGGNHIMLMKMDAPVKPGDEVTFTLTLADGSTVNFTAQAKEFSGANETYAS